MNFERFLDLQIVAIPNGDLSIVHASYYSSRVVHCKDACNRTRDTVDTPGAGDIPKLQRVVL